MASYSSLLTGRSPSFIEPRSVSASTSFTLADASRPWVENTGASAITMTILADLGYTIGDVLEGRQGGTGTVAFAAGAGVTLSVVAGTTATTASVGQRVRAQHRGSNVWEYL